MYYNRKNVIFGERKIIKMDELQGIIDAMLPEIQSRLNSAPSVFNLWFGGLKLRELNESTAIFVTPSNLRKKLLSTKHKAIITEVLCEVIGFEVEVVIESAEEESDFNSEPEEPTLPEDRSESEKREKEIKEFLSDKNPQKRSLIEEYTFDNFIEGASNKFARAACLAVANEPTTYNPLFIHGHSGLGKTHLLYAVINELKKKHPTLKIVYKKSEDFINELIKSIEERSTADFKEKYRTADVLLIDDIQFLAGKEATQEEFFHTFSALYESDKQIILTSDRPPKDIRPLEDRLRTRFEGGLLADVQPPSFELRTAIIKKKASSLGLFISNELVDYIAERLHSNIRQIEGVIKKLQAFVSINGMEINRDSVDKAISIIDPGNIPTSVLVERIIDAVAKEFDVTAEDMKSKKKTDNIARARHTAIYIIRNLTELSYKAIGEIFNRDHSTVINSIEKVNVNIKTVKNEKSTIDRLIKKVKE